MTRKTHCDICDEEINRTFKKRGSKAKAYQGKDSIKVKRSFRRRLIQLLLGPVMKVAIWKQGRYSPWSRVDICRSCRYDIEEYINDEL